jgi:hypothetical protein
MLEKSGEIDDQVSDHGKKVKGLNPCGFSQEVFDVSPACQDIFAIDPHGTGTAYGATTGITEGECPILFVLNAQ